MRSRYDLMSESDVLDTDGEARPDVLSLPLENFKQTSAPLRRMLTPVDIRRIDLLMYKIYGYAEFDDLVLAFSKIDSLNNAEAGEEVVLPSKTDLEQFYFRNRKS